ARQRGRDDREGVRRVAAEARGIGQHRQEPLELDDGARPAVREEERQGLSAHARLVDEVKLDPADLDGELAKAVQPGLVHAPLVLRPPVLDQLPHVSEARAVAPAGLRRLVGPADALEPGAEVREHRVGHLDRERSWRHLALSAPCFAASTQACQASGWWPIATWWPLLTSGVLRRRGSMSAFSTRRSGESPARSRPRAFARGLARSISAAAPNRWANRPSSPRAAGRSFMSTKCTVTPRSLKQPCA